MLVKCGYDHACKTRQKVSSVQKSAPPSQYQQRPIQSILGESVPFAAPLLPTATAFPLALPKEPEGVNVTFRTSHPVSTPAKPGRRRE